MLSAAARSPKSSAARPSSPEAPSSTSRPAAMTLFSQWASRSANTGFLSDTLPPIFSPVRRRIPMMACSLAFVCVLKDCGRKPASAFPYWEYRAAM